ncbi:MAG: hypothetical protein ACI9SB_001335, partial [Candidatus Azotimanducaceae bacterium]
ADELKASDAANITMAVESFLKKIIGQFLHLRIRLR